MHTLLRIRLVYKGVALWPLIPSSKQRLQLTLALRFTTSTRTQSYYVTVQYSTYLYCSLSKVQSYLLHLGSYPYYFQSMGCCLRAAPSSSFLLACIKGPANSKSSSYSRRWYNPVRRKSSLLIPDTDRQWVTADNNRTHLLSEGSFSFLFHMGL